MATTDINGQPVTQADTQQATASQINTSTLPQMNAATNTVNEGNTVNGLLAKYMDKNNPLMQTAMTGASQAANDRGMLNSSMAVQAGQQAMINTATPIAQADANIYSSVAQQNASNQQQANQYNTGLQNQAITQNAANLQQTNQFNAQQSNAQSQFNTSQSNDILKAGMDYTNRTNLANIEATYKTLMQANSSAGELYQQTVKNITDIQGNKDMTADTKASAITNQLTYLKTGVGLVEKMNNLSGLDELLTF